VIMRRVHGGFTHKRGWITNLKLDIFSSYKMST
jgi:hypothetical protein